MTIPDSVKICT